MAVRASRSSLSSSLIVISPSFDGQDYSAFGSEHFDAKDWINSVLSQSSSDPASLEVRSGCCRLYWCLIKLLHAIHRMQQRHVCQDCKLLAEKRSLRWIGPHLH